MNLVVIWVNLVVILAENINVLNANLIFFDNMTKLGIIAILEQVGTAAYGKLVQIGNDETNTNYSSGKGHAMWKMGKYVYLKAYIHIIR